MPDNILLHKIGDAVISDEAAETISYWQRHDNDNIEGHIVEIMKSVGFIARIAEQAGEPYIEPAMRHIIYLSGIAEELEVFKK